MNKYLKLLFFIRFIISIIVAISGIVTLIIGIITTNLIFIRNAFILLLFGVIGVFDLICIYLAFWRDNKNGN